MSNYFNINIEFDHSDLRSKISDAILHEKVSYVCVVDSNVLTIANTDKSYLRIINESLVNTCDGSSIAFLLNTLYLKKFQTFNGPDLFQEYSAKQMKQVFLGGSLRTQNDLKVTFSISDINSTNKLFLELPYLEVDDFDFPAIAEKINHFSPDIIWVSLGAPKQEKFMSQLKLYLTKGVMFGIGAAFNFYLGQIRQPKFKIFSLSFIWFFRLLSEPKKQSKRIIKYLYILPSLYYSELKKAKGLKGENAL